MERIYFSANVAAMSSDMHEILIDMFRGRPEFAAEMLGDLSVRVPAHVRAEAASGDLPDLSPTEYRADSVITFSNVDGPVFAVVIEVQLARDKRKRWSWPVYLTTLRAGCGACGVAGGERGSGRVEVVRSADRGR